MKAKVEHEEEGTIKPPNDGCLHSLACCSAMCGERFVYMVAHDGHTQAIGVAAVCPGRMGPHGWEKCDRIYRLKKFAGWPMDLTELVWSAIARKKTTSYLARIGFFVYRRRDGSLVHMDDVVFPEYQDPKELTEECRSWLVSHVNSGRSVPARIKADFGKVLESTVEAVKFPKDEKNPPADGYAPSQEEYEEIPF